MNLLPKFLRGGSSASQTASWANPLALMNRATQALTSTLHVKLVNRWRDQFNPLRGLTIGRAVSYMEDGERGAYADLQWLYRYVEKRYDVLTALLSRYESGLSKLDWQIKTVAEDELPKGGTEAQAEAQADFLRSKFELIRNLKEATDFLCSARFRGFAHLEKISNAQAMKLADTDPNRYGRVPRDGVADEETVLLQPVEQWYWVRDGQNGAWLYNKNAQAGTVTGEPVSYEQFIIREVTRPVNEIALIAYVRANLCDKDWDGFIETYGIPFLFLIGPPNVPKDKESAYQEVAQKIIADSRGYLPNGSDIKTGNAAERGNNPFKERMDDLKERVVLAGTGGKLTMLSDATGIGQGATPAHSDAWEDIIQAEAMRISEVFHEQFAAPLLEAEFPGQPPLAYFELCAYEETDTGAVIDEIAKLSTAGFQVSTGQVQEKTGYEVEIKEVAPAFSPSPFNRERAGVRDEADDRALRNRAVERQALGTLAATALQQLGEAQADVLAPVRSRLRGILELRNVDAMRSAWTALQAELPALLEQINQNPDTARVLANAQVAAFFNGAARGSSQIGNRADATPPPPLPPPPIELNISMQPGERKKRVEFQRDSSGVVTGAKITEEQQ